MSTDMNATIRISKSPYIRYKTEKNIKVKSSKTPVNKNNSRVYEPTELNRTKKALSPIKKDSQPAKKPSLSAAPSKNNYQPINKKLRTKVAIKTYSLYLKTIREARFRTRFDLLL